VLTSSLNSMAHLESVRALIRAVSSHEKEIMRMSDENGFSLEFLTMQMVERTPVSAQEDADHMDTADSPLVNAVTSVTPEVDSVQQAAATQPHGSAMEVDAHRQDSAAVDASASKKAKKSAKKLTIQTSSERAELLQALTEQSHSEDVPEDEGAESQEPQDEAAEEIVFTTPGKAKKDKKAAKSGPKSLLKSAKKANSEELEEGDVPATADRRVSFSHPLSMVKIISPIDSQRKTFGKKGFASTPVGKDGDDDRSSGNGSGKKSASKKRLWSDDA
jgi:hypothetical protein